MNDMQDLIDRVILEVRNKSNIVIPKDDPILAVFVAHKILLDELLVKIKENYEQNNEDIKLTANKILESYKSKAEDKINAGIKTLILSLEESLNAAINDVNKDKQSAIDELKATATNAIAQISAKADPMQFNLHYGLVAGIPILCFLAGFLLGRL